MYTCTCICIVYKATAVSLLVRQLLQGGTSVVGGAYASEFGETEEILKTREAVDKFAAEVIERRGKNLRKIGTLTQKPRPESGLDCLACSDFARQA